MRALRGVIVLVLGLVLPAPVAAADLQAGVEAYKRNDYAAALKEFHPLAEQGDANAQMVLGIMYEDGQGVTQDYALAAEWYEAAAVQGYVQAQILIATTYRDGQGVTQDCAEAARWFQLAAEQGQAVMRAEAQRLAREWKPK
jgi:hypothetical protein